MLIIMSVSIIILMVILFSGQDRLSRIETSVGETQIRNSLDKLTDAADFVYSQGVGASTSVYITVPPGVKEVGVESHSFVFVVRAQGNVSEFPGVTTAKLRGSIDETPGSRYVVLRNEGEYVSVE